MTNARFAGTVAVAFLVSQVLAILVHGFMLAADYAPFYGTLLRPMPTGGEWRMLLLPLTHLSYVAALTWIHRHLDLRGSTLQRGAKLGMAGWLVGQLPLWMLWYAEQPWPGALVVKQLGLELASSLVIGVVIVAIARSGVSRIPTAA